ncbi:MAG: fatty acid hydroxylase [Gammaproteobacteria bacterium]|jgi:sterol desaturase/sphingolipid hydroxylase (fatty acid hydroxylase superfamily)|nr:fatty acid hydroxylase [Gammaproteobacteria bacterium]
MTLTPIMIMKIVFLPLWLLMVAGFVIFAFLFRKQLACRKVDPTYPPFNRIFKDACISFISPLFFYPSSIFFAYCVVMHKGFVYTDIHQYGIPYFIFSLLLAIVFHDFYYYWMHRAIHTRWLFRKIHRIHHYSHNPTALTFLTLHPIETMLTSLSIPMCIFLFPINVNALIILYMLILIHAAYAHNGYEWFTSKLSKQWFNNAVAHYFHHKHAKVNYSYYFLFWDRLFGTLDKKYEETFDKVSDRIQGKNQAPTEATVCNPVSN